MQKDGNALAEAAAEGSEPPVRVAVLGAGAVGCQVHLPLLRSLPGVEITVIAEQDAAARRAIQAVVPRSRVVADWREVLETEGLHAVVIALPPALHSPAARMAFSHGLHVYLEKPIAATLPEGHAILDAWRASQRVGMVGFNYRRNPLVARLRERLAAGEIGKPRTIRSRFTSHLRVAGWRARREEGGGVLQDLASHHIDLWRHLLGGAIVRVEATLRSVTTEGDQADLSVTFDHGAEAHGRFELGTVAADQLEVEGDLGTAGYDRVRSVDVRVETVGTGRRRPNLTAALVRQWYRVQKWRAPWNEPSFQPALKAFITGCRRRARVSPDLEDGWQALRVVQAAHQSAATGEIVTMAPDPSTSNPAVAAGLS